MKSRRALQKYLRRRHAENPNDALFCVQSGTRLSTDGMRQMLVNRAKLAGIEPPGFHDFRRAFTVLSLRNRASTLAIARQLGHSTVNLVERYAKKNDEDLKEIHDDTSPLDNL